MVAVVMIAFVAAASLGVPTPPDCPIPVPPVFLRTVRDDAEMVS